MALTDAHILLLAEAVRAGHLSALRVVDLTRSWWVGADAWGDLMQAIMDCEGGLPKLQKLRLGETKVKEAGGKVAAALGSGQLPSLVSLGMDFDDRDVGPFLFGQEGVDALNEGVRAGRFPSRLREVDFRLKQTHTHTHTHANETSIKLDGLIMAIAEGPVGLPRCVTRLNLRGGQMSVEALACFAARPGGSVSPQRGNGKLSGLKSLNLSRCAIDDERLGRLGEVFCAHVCPRLEFLSLAENKISGAGLTAFFTALSPKSLPKLRRLYLAEQESPLTEDRVQRLQANARFQGKLSKLEECFDERDLTKQFMDPFTPDRQGSSSESDEPKESRLYLGN
uniref:Uncharacterized protein n=1 Tax=Chromera velia CCMP2878 TaxID=1169474 RepID=A0A0G4FLL4_9ALVE|eukprot:Cvel_398.t1-p1 / transcript=Cvel_398.t1 / gene=Cvel_398 / organism=Chromera_velia_CCMP2878 / gene_product=hypothetical protein / transcript_product=hypothetical protein / location=Cvel_scaffold13:22001-23011(-) / protein_length=337 / sequence_SO=supercontig / SO=protein_coding / is_pseudo=false